MVLRDRSPRPTPRRVRHWHYRLAGSVPRINLRPLWRVGGVWGRAEGQDAGRPPRGPDIGDRAGSRRSCNSTRRGGDRAGARARRNAGASAQLDVLLAVIAGGVLTKAYHALGWVRVSAPPGCCWLTSRREGGRSYAGQERSLLMAFLQCGSDPRSQLELAAMKRARRRSVRTRPAMAGSKRPK
jgi:hypothetical protein